MPLIAGLLSSFFGMIAGVLARRLTIGIAAAAAFVTTTLAAYVAVKLAFAALVSGLTFVAPPAVIAGVGYFMPSNLAACLTAILIGDALISSWSYWRQTLGVAVNLARG